MKYRICWLNTKTNTKGAGPWFPENMKDVITETLNASVEAAKKPTSPHHGFEYRLEEAEGSV